MRGSALSGTMCSMTDTPIYDAWLKEFNESRNRPAITMTTPKPGVKPVRPRRRKKATAS